MSLGQIISHLANKRSIKNQQLLPPCRSLYLECLYIENCSIQSVIPKFSYLSLAFKSLYGRVVRMFFILFLVLYRGKRTRRGWDVPMNTCYRQRVVCLGADYYYCYLSYYLLLVEVTSWYIHVFHVHCIIKGS